MPVVQRMSVRSCGLWRLLSALGRDASHVHGSAAGERSVQSDERLGFVDEVG